MRVGVVIRWFHRMLQFRWDYFMSHHQRFWKPLIVLHCKTLQALSKTSGRIDVGSGEFVYRNPEPSGANL